MSAPYVYVPLKGFQRVPEASADPYPEEVMRLLTESPGDYKIKGKSGSVRIEPRAIEFAKQGRADFVRIRFSLRGIPETEVRPGSDALFSFTFSKRRSPQENLKKLARFIFQHGMVALVPAPVTSPGLVIGAERLPSNTERWSTILAFVTDIVCVFVGMMLALVFTDSWKGTGALPRLPPQGWSILLLVSAFVGFLSVLPYVLIVHWPRGKGLQFLPLVLIIGLSILTVVALTRLAVRFDYTLVGVVTPLLYFLVGCALLFWQLRVAAAR